MPAGRFEPFLDLQEVSQLQASSQRAGINEAETVVDRQLSVEDLRSVGWVSRESGSGTREHFDRAMAESGITPRIVLELEQPEAVRQCVRLGLGVGCLSSLELCDAFQAGWLVPLATPFLGLSRQLRIALHAQKYRTRGIQAVLDLCRSQA